MPTRNENEALVVPLTLWGRIVAWAQLLRLANVFTVVADVWMGLILTTGGLHGWVAFGMTATSCLLYLSGMVMNDAFDHQVDAKERPDRPIPSRRVSLSAATWLAAFLLVSGIATGWATTLVTPNAAPGILATLLAGAIVAYNVGLKSTLLGPTLMAVCRVINLMFAMSTVAQPIGWSFNFTDAPLIPVLGIGLYVFGISWFARGEAGTSQRWLLVLATFLILAGLFLIASMPFSELTIQPPLRLQSGGWILLWCAIAAMILRRVALAIASPRPEFVQQAVGNAILSIITIDAAIVLGYGDTFWALAILSLYAPSVLLSQWLKVS